MTAQRQPAPTAARARARYVIFGLKFRHWIPISRTFETAEQARRYAETLQIGRASCRERV